MDAFIKKHFYCILDYLKSENLSNLFRRAPIGKDKKIIIKFYIDPDTLLRIPKKIEIEKTDE